jgi:hypothetical protein
MKKRCLEYEPDTFFTDEMGIFMTFYQSSSSSQSQPRERPVPLLLVVVLFFLPVALHK